MRDEHDRHSEPALQVGQQLQDLGLDCHIERRGGLVGNEHLGPVRERHRDHDTLALPARQLVRVGIHLSLGLGMPTKVSISNAPRPRLRAAQFSVRPQRLFELPADLVERIQEVIGSWKIMPMRLPR